MSTPSTQNAPAVTDTGVTAWADTPASTPAHVTHGMGYDRVEPDWAPLTDVEAAEVLDAVCGPGRTEVSWRSPRPLSAAALVEHGGCTVFLKRHHVGVRSAAGLGEEHAFLRHLRSRGAPVVEVLGAHARDEWTYEVHAPGAGTDLYQDALSWTPFTSAAHAHAAGAALARFHLAAAGHQAPARSPQPLVSSWSVFAGPDPLAALDRYTAARPALAEALEAAPVRADTERFHLPFHDRLRPLLDQLEPLWTHNDWHASNLLWSLAPDGDPLDARVATVLDVGLSDRTTAMHDLALALERNVFGWLELPRTPDIPVRLDQLDALLAGYTAHRPLSDAEAHALPLMLTLVNAEYALTEMDYFHGITRSRANTALARAYYTEHTAWFTTTQGHAVLQHLHRRLEV
ncbi:phosphotransferase enzyme family protein [Streptomyces sp. MBT97]|uniref:phosphotransferase enzyme family protein n=1 Tax=Streptomyces sp. MBT97 TaxID=2800411 RepID=UPI001F26B0F5|nr:phosphotransferase [Streptomyces sp. MBT97]